MKNYLTQQNMIFTLAIVAGISLIVKLKNTGPSSCACGIK